MFNFEKVADVADYLALMDGEEYNRSAISRYYYSLFCSTRLYLILILGETRFIKGKDIHTKVCDRLKMSDDLTENNLGNILEDLRQLRNFADYDWYIKDSSFYKKNLNYVKNESRVGLEQLNALKNSPPYKV